MVKSICDGAPGFLQLDDESGEPEEEDRFYSKLIENGYTGLFLGSVDEKGAGPLKLLFDSAFPPK